VVQQQRLLHDSNNHHTKPSLLSSQANVKYEVIKEGGGVNSSPLPKLTVKYLSKIKNKRKKEQFRNGTLEQISVSDAFLTFNGK